MWNLDKLKRRIRDVVFKSNQCECSQRTVWIIKVSQEKHVYNRKVDWNWHVWETQDSAEKYAAAEFTWIAPLQIDARNARIFRWVGKRFIDMLLFITATKICSTDYGIRFCFRFLILPPASSSVCRGCRTQCVRLWECIAGAIVQCSLFVLQTHRILCVRCACALLPFADRTSHFEGLNTEQPDGWWCFSECLGIIIPHITDIACAVLIHIEAIDLWWIGNRQTDRIFLLSQHPIQVRLRHFAFFVAGPDEIWSMRRDRKLPIFFFFSALWIVFMYEVTFQWIEVFRWNLFKCK